MIRTVLALSALLLLLSGPARADDFLARAETCFAQGNFKKAARYAEKALKADPANLRAGICLAESFSERGRIKAAITQYKAMIAEHPDNLDLMLRLGLVFDKGRYHPQAVETYNRVLAKEPNSALAHYRLGVSHAMVMNLSDAYTQYRIVKGLDAGLADDLLERIQTNK
ncbi:hypothetical protein JCM14469_23190 [Desulfatiferula olefinivorans]